MCKKCVGAVYLLQRHIFFTSFSLDQKNKEAKRKMDENKESPSTMTTRGVIVLYNDRFQAGI